MDASRFSCVTTVIAGFVYLASALWFVPGGEVENLNLVTQENREASQHTLSPLLQRDLHPAPLHG